MPNKTESVRNFIEKRIRDTARTQGKTLLELRDDFSLVETGLFDSLSFVQLISAIEKEFNIAIDTGDLEPEEFTLLGNLARVAADSKPAEEFENRR
jgi:acyl carrier protein